MEAVHHDSLNVYVCIMYTHKYFWEHTQEVHAIWLLSRLWSTQGWKEDLERGSKESTPPPPKLAILLQPHWLPYSAIKPQPHITLRYLDWPLPLIGPVFPRYMYDKILSFPSSLAWICTLTASFHTDIWPQPLLWTLSLLASSTFCFIPSTFHL